MTLITFSVQARPRDHDSWTGLARRLEFSGFDALLVADHPGLAAAPWSALGAAAAVTTRLNLGTYVLQAGLRDPIQTATEAATLNVLAPARVRLGLGAGHTYQEWTSLGKRRPPGRDRAQRLEAFLIATKKLLEGETVTMLSDALHLADARLEGFTNEHRIELLVGGSHPLILAAGAKYADIVALSGLGRTLPDGHSHETNWTASALESQLEVIRQTAERVERKPAIEVLVHEVTLTHTAPVSAEKPSPFALVGRVADMADQIRLQAAKYNITRYVVREPDIDVIERVIRNLREEE